MSIKAEHLKYTYNKKLPDATIAVDDVSFEIKDGEFVSVIGHTGSGKSTLLQHINKLIVPDDGKIFIDGEEIIQSKMKMLNIRKKVGFVFQYPEYQLFEETVGKDVSFGPKNLKLSDDEVKERVKEALELVGFNYDEIKDKSPFDLSGGEKRRVAIAGVIAMRPRVLILDEPTAGLDPKTHKDILKMIDNIHKSMENIVIFVSHNMDDVAKISDKIIVMSKGKILMNGTPEEVFKNKQILEENELDVPPIMELTENLNKKGFDIDANILEPEALAKEIAEALSK